MERERRDRGKQPLSLCVHLTTVMTVCASVQLEWWGVESQRQEMEGSKSTPMITGFIWKANANEADILEVSVRACLVLTALKNNFYMSF